MDNNVLDILLGDSLNVTTCSDNSGQPMIQFDFTNQRRVITLAETLEMVGSLCWWLQSLGFRLNFSGQASELSEFTDEQLKQELAHRANGGLT